MDLITNFEKSNQYRSKIHNLIPGGAHTYSKGDDQFPQLSPAAFTHGKGAYVWDLDGNKYLDCTMGLASISLGHAYQPVIERVASELKKGVNFQRPAAIEMEMAERFLELVSMHDMVKFAKNGSTVTTAAVKIARGYSGRKLVAFPEDHPFYSFDDWFIGKRECNLGVPEEVSALSLCYNSKDLTTLEALFEKHPNQIACVISEAERPDGVPEGYLERLIELTHRHGALFILDEMITGYKMGFPGAISKYKVKPDLATWGKGIANGFSFCALTGTREVMEWGGIRRPGAEKLFLISSTHGGETHSLAAALETMNIFEKESVTERNKETCRYFTKVSLEAIRRNHLSDFVEVVQSDWMPVLTFKDKSKLVSHPMRTLAIQELIKRGVLYQASFNCSFSHTPADIDYFGEALDQSLKVYAQALELGWQKFLVGEPVKPVFRKFI